MLMFTQFMAGFVLHALRFCSFFILYQCINRNDHEKTACCCGLKILLISKQVKKTYTNGYQQEDEGRTIYNE